MPIRHLWKISLVIAVILVVFAATDSQAKAARADEIVAVLVRRFDAGASHREPAPATGTLLRELLESGAGTERLQALDEQRPELVFDALRGAIVWLHERVPAPRSQMCLGTVCVNTVDLPLVGHAGFPHQLQLRTLSCDGLRLVIRLETTDEPLESEWFTQHDLQPGRTYDAIVPLPNSITQQVKMEHITEYRLVED